MCARMAGRTRKAPTEGSRHDQYLKKPTSLLDKQAIFDATWTLYAAMLSGGNVIHDMGYIESGLTGSLELVAIEDEIVSLSLRLRRWPEGGKRR